jgi:hypothetical protein
MNHTRVLVIDGTRAAWNGLGNNMNRWHALFKLAEMLQWSGLAYVVHHVIDTHSKPCLLRKWSPVTWRAISATSTACHVIGTESNTRFLIQVTSYDVVSYICLTLPSGQCTLTREDAAPAAGGNSTLTRSPDASSTQPCTLKATDSTGAGTLHGK